MLSINQNNLVEKLLVGLEFMMVSRLIDDRCTEEISKGIKVPNYHSGRGQEALAVSLGLALSQEDYLLYNYRDFAGLLAKGIGLDDLVADLLLKETGTNKGYGGIMHVVNPSIGIIGRNGVFGSRFGIAVGLAIAIQAKGSDAVVFCSYGEAEGGRGPLYEAINISIIRSLPIVFIPANNGFSISTRTSELYAGGDMSSLWRGGPMPVRDVDGNDLVAILSSLNEAIEHARLGKGPSLVELKTYRVDAHIPAEIPMFGNHVYRNKAEIDSWVALDPIDRLSNYLKSNDLTNNKSLDDLWLKSKVAVSNSFDLALSQDYPGPETISQYIYFDSEFEKVSK